MILIFLSFNVEKDTINSNIIINRYDPTPIQQG